jgi:hypothetical protein
MSQQLIPINGGVQQVVTTKSTVTANLVSPQYIIANSLQSRPTEWVPGGRPIYRRLPAVSETYQIDFFNIVSPPNTAVRAELQKIGYVYVPFTESSEGSTSMFVSASESNKDLIIRGGRIVWSNGGTQVYPAIVNLQNLELGAGSYFLGYELVYDDAPQQKIYTVDNFALTGQPLTITSSTSNIVGWRFLDLNAFLNTTDLFWSPIDTYFPTYAQPTESYIQWESSLGAAYSNITLRCPSGVSSAATASLFYITATGVSILQQSIKPSIDTTGYYYEFKMTSPVFNTGWKVVWSDKNVSIQSITVSGAVTLLKKPSGPMTRASLVIYPREKVPSSGTYCPLANMTVSNDFQVTSVEDIRFVIHRDYVPISDWLTKFFDDNLINLYEQVLEYPLTWMSPPTCMKQEYLDLISKNIAIV